MSLSSFPPELLGLICASLEQEAMQLRSSHRIYDDWIQSKLALASLAGIAGTCKGFHGIAQPVLTKCYTRWRRKPLNFHLIPYIRTILNDPGLARREAWFTVHPYPVFGEPGKGDISILDEVTHRLGMPPPSEWLRRIGPFSDRSILVQIILANLPNLESLTLSNNRLRFNYLRPGSLPSLKKADLTCINREYGSPLIALNLGAFETLFHASTNLEVLEMRSYIHCDSALPLGNILSLRFHRSILSSLSLHQVQSIHTR
jgi:Leucine-rich repeat (LRR) protein